MNKQGARQRARTALRNARKTVRPHGVGNTADAQAMKKTLAALLAYGLTLSMADRVAALWGLPASAWARARKVAPRSLATYKTGQRTEIPQDLLP